MTLPLGRKQAPLASMTAVTAPASLFRSIPWGSIPTDRRYTDRRWEGGVGLYDLQERRMMALFVSSFVAALLYMACWAAMRTGRIPLRLTAVIGGIILTTPILIDQLSKRRGAADLLCMGVPTFVLAFTWTLIIGQVVQHRRNGEREIREEQ